MIRLFDLLISILVLIISMPILIVVALLIKTSSKGPIFYMQTRAGRFEKPFKLLKFRTMKPNSDGVKITVGEKDPRITKIGTYLRKYKLDELPQLINVIKGDMSLVGPRPEVFDYVNTYTEEQKKVLHIRPGITDRASIVFSNENALLAEQANPIEYYKKVIIPEKIKLNQSFIHQPTLRHYFSILFLTLRKILSTS